MVWIRKSTHFFDKSHFMVPKVNEYKKHHAMKFVNIEESRKLLQDKDAVITIKYDGELTGLYHDGSKSYLISREGRIRTDLPLTDEIAKVLGDREFIGYGELYAIGSNGNPLPYPKAVSILRVPEGKEDKIRFMLFDTDEEGNYSDKITALKQIFSDVKYTTIVDLYTSKDLDSLWSKVTDKNQGKEGLVVRIADDIYKIKPIITVDAVVIAIQKSDKHEYMGALLLALLDEENVFRTISHVGTGFKVKEREQWLKWANHNSVSEDDNYIWVKPERIVEVEAVEVNIVDTPAFTFDGKQWTSDGERPSATLRMPSYKKERTDKQVNPSDLRLEQLPGWVRESKMKKEAFEPEHKDTIVVKPNEFYPKGLTEMAVWDYYNFHKRDILPDINGKEVLTVVKTDGIVIKRHIDNGFIIMDEAIYDKLNNGRTLELHLVLGDTVDYYFVDLDPKDEFDFSQTKEIAAEVSELLADIENVKEVEIRFSGSRGFHIYGYTAGEMKTEEAKQNLKEYMEDYLKHKNDPSLTLGASQNPKSMRLDISTYHEKGSLRALGSLSSKTGLKCMTVTREGLKKFEKKLAQI